MLAQPASLAIAIAVLAAGTLTACGGGSSGNEPPTISIELYAGSDKTQAGADGTGAAASFGTLHGLTRDAAGNLYTVDTANNTVRKITPAGVATTVAGANGIPGGTDGPADQARFNRPQGLALGPDGQVWVADTGNHTIRRIAADGTVSTVAGLAGVEGAADGPAGTSRLSSPESIAVDGQGNAYVADTGNCAIRRIDALGIAEHWLGSAGSCADASGITWAGTDVPASWPAKIALSSDQKTLYFQSQQYGGPNLLHYRVATKAPLIWLASTSGQRWALNTFSEVLALLPLDDGGLLVSGSVPDGAGTRKVLRSLNANGGLRTDIIGGSNFWGTTTGDGPLSQTRWGDITGLASDATGNLYLVDSTNASVRQLNTDNQASTLAGGSAQAFVDGNGTEARFGGNLAMAAASSDWLAVSDMGNRALRWIATQGTSHTLTQSPYELANFYVTDVRIDAPGNLYALATGPGLVVTPQIWVMAKGGSQWTKLAEIGALNGAAGDQYVLPAALAQGAGPTWFVLLSPAEGLSHVFAVETAPASTPREIAVGKFSHLTSQGTDVVYASSPTQHAIYKIDGVTGKSAVYAGQEGVVGTTDGPVKSALLSFPGALTFDDKGNLYVAARGASSTAIRRISADGQVSTLVTMPPAAANITSLATQGNWLYVSGNAAIYRVGPIGGS